MQDMRGVRVELTSGKLRGGKKGAHDKSLCLAVLVGSGALVVHGRVAGEGGRAALRGRLGLPTPAAAPSMPPWPLPRGAPHRLSNPAGLPRRLPRRGAPWPAPTNQERPVPPGSAGGPQRSGAERPARARRVAAPAPGMYKVGERKQFAQCARGGASPTRAEERGAAAAVAAAEGAAARAGERQALPSASPLLKAGRA